MNSGARVVAVIVVGVILGIVRYSVRSGGPVRSVPGRSDVVEVDKGDMQLKAATDEARSRWPEWVAAWNDKKPGRTYAVLVDMRARGSAGEEIWIKVDSFNGRTISGRLMKDPYGAVGKKKGDRVSVEAADVRDWLYEEADGTVTGAFTEKVLEEMQKKGK